MTERQLCQRIYLTRCSLLSSNFLTAATRPTIRNIDVVMLIHTKRHRSVTRFLRPNNVHGVVYLEQLVSTSKYRTLCVRSICSKAILYLKLLGYTNNLTGWQIHKYSKLNYHKKVPLDKS